MNNLTCIVYIFKKGRLKHNWYLHFNGSNPGQQVGRAWARKTHLLIETFVSPTHLCSHSGPSKDNKLSTFLSS